METLQLSPVFSGKWVLMFNRNDRHTAVLLISDVERMVR